jgi:deoxyribonuclease-4
VLIGSHVSISGGLLGAAKEAASYGASAMMVYTGAPQNTRRVPLEKMKIDEGLAFCRENGIEKIVVHAPYIINLASPKDGLFTLAKDMLADELRRTDAFGAEFLVVHPGAYTESDLDSGIKRIAEGINGAADGTKAMICLETMSGKGTEIGRSFEELARIIELCENKNRVMVCFDTCHTHDAGYGIAGDLDAVMAEFDRVVGLEKLRVFHINGSLNQKGARKDRHANIGAGADNPKGKDYIGFEAVSRLAHSTYAGGRPLILETPWISDTENLYKEEIAAIRRGSL